MGSVGNNNPREQFYDRRLHGEKTANQLTAEALNLQLTIEELKILKECQRNSILQRGLPMGAVTMGGFYYLMKIGLLKRSRIALTINGIAAFVIGTMSYRQTCRDKLMALPNSTLKERILIAQGKQPQVRVELQPQDGQGWFDSVLPSSDQAPMTSSLDIEPYQSNSFDGFPNNAIDTDAHYAVDPPLQPIVGKPYSTYDELRQRNREDYERARNNREPQRADIPLKPPTDPLLSPLDRPYDSSSSQPPRRSDDFL